MKLDQLPDTITAWQCIGCGRLEAPQNCIGVCQDRKVELVSAWDYAEALTALEDARESAAALESLLSKLAHTTPRGDAWKETYLALQKEARGLLAQRTSSHDAQHG
jgi:hypothetical protein